MAEPITTAMAAIKTAATWAAAKGTAAAATKAGTAALTSAGAAAAGAVVSDLLTDKPDAPKVTELADPDSVTKKADDRREMTKRLAQSSQVNSRYSRSNLG